MTLKEMERHLTQIYSRARKDIGRDWFDYLQKVGSELNDIYRRLQGARALGDQAAIKQLTKQYQEAVKELTIYNDKYKAMVKDVTGQLKNVDKTALAYINGTLPATYAYGYNKLKDDVKNIDGYNFALVDPYTVKNLATSDKTLLPYKEQNGQKLERWNTKIINSQVMQGILAGESIPNIANRLYNVMNQNEAAAIRNARTMTTSAENKGRQDSYEQAEKDGVIMKKIWIASIDDKTRAEHLALDGVEVDVNASWKNNYGEIKYPGDPEADPCNVYNCRCSTGTRPIGFRKPDGTVNLIDYSKVNTDIQRLVKVEIIDRNGNAIESNVRVSKPEAEEIKQEYLDKRLQNEGKSSIMEIGRSLGAAAKNYPVKMPDSNDHTKLAEGQTIIGKTFAGAGTDGEIRDRYYLESRYHIPAEKWEKVSGKGYVMVDGKAVEAELHWYEAEGERYEMKIKRFINESEISKK